MEEELTVEDVLNLVESYAQWMRMNGPSDMRDMLGYINSIRRHLKNGDSRKDILAWCSVEDGA